MGSLGWRMVLEIVVLWIAIYYIYRAFRATRAARILVGMAFVILVVTALSQFFELEVIQFLLEKFLAFLAIALVVLFQPELRSALARLGSSRLFKALNLYEDRQRDFAEEFVATVIMLSKKRVGALFAFQNSIQLKDVIETGTSLDAGFTEDLCHSIFFPKSPLHDGGVVIVGNRIAAAGCIFPISNDYFQDKSFGLRHRAAVGITQESDALTVIISEETGHISLCSNGEVAKNLSENEFREKIERALLSNESGEVSEQLEE